MRPRERRNALLNAAGEALFGFKFWLVPSATVLTVLLTRYGASERMLGAIVSIETACSLLPQLLGAWVFRSRRRLKRRLIIWHIAAMLPFLLLMGLLTFRADALDPALYRWLMLACHGGYWLAIGIVVAAWMDFLAHIFPAEVRGTAMGLASFASAMAGTGAGLLAGWLILRNPGPEVFGWMYVAAWLIGTGSMFLWVPVEDAGAEGAADAPPPTLRELADCFRAAFREANFRALLAGRLLGVLGFCIAPFVARYYSSTAGGALADSTIVSCGAAATLGGAIGGLALGRIGDHRGHRTGMLIGMALQAATLLTLLFGHGLPGCVLSYACMGLAGGCGISFSNLVYETCRHPNRLAHIALANLAVGSVMVFAPLAGGLVAERWGLPALFAASLALSLAALAWFSLAFRDPRARPAG
jgi:MFS family permease